MHRKAFDMCRINMYKSMAKSFLVLTHTVHMSVAFDGHYAAVHGIVYKCMLAYGDVKILLSLSACARARVCSSFSLSSLL